MKPVSDTTRPRFRRAVLALKILASLVLLVSIGLFLEPQRVWGLLGELQSDSLVAVVVLSLIGLGIQWRKWQTLLAFVRPQTKGSESLISLLVGFSLGMVSPGRIGEVGRGLGLVLSSDSRAACMGVATADRLCSAAVTIGLGMIAFLMLAPVAGILAAAIVCAIALIAYRWGGGRRLMAGDAPSWLRGTRAGLFVNEALRALVTLPRALWLRSLGLSLAFQLLLCFQFHLLATNWMSSSAELWLGIPLIFAAKTVLPIAFLDLGVREAASVFIFVKLNFDPAVGFNCALLLYAINVVLPAIIGTIAWALSTGREARTPTAKASPARNQALMAWLTLFIVASGTIADGQSGGENAGVDGGVPPMVRLVEQGDAQAERGQIGTAIEKYEQARKLGAGSAYVLNRLAQLYMESSQPQQAIDLLRQSLRESPGQLPVYSMLGESFLTIGQVDSALACVHEARELAPEASSIRSYLGLLNLQSGRLEQAKAELDTAVSLDAKNAEAYRFLGIYHTQLDSLDRAIDSYERVVELRPGDVEAHNNIAFLHSRQQRYRAALDYYRRTKNLTSDPNILHSVNINMEAVRAIMSGKLRARYILVYTEAEGRGILKRLHEGEEFADLAAQFSKAPNAHLGGDLGYFGPGDMLPEVEEAVLQLEPGGVSDPISIQQGVMILQRLN